MHDVDESVIDAVFDAWLDERHASADRSLFLHACSSLETIRERHPTVVEGAITTGRGNPLMTMPSIASLFAFCVSGEDNDVFPGRKLDGRIYGAAILRQI